MEFEINERFHRFKVRLLELLLLFCQEYGDNKMRTHGTEREYCKPRNSNKVQMMISKINDICVCVCFPYSFGTEHTQKKKEDETCDSHIFKMHEIPFYD